MSAAINATSAKERAKILARFIKAGRESGRALNDCLEMGDGEEVKAHLRIMLTRSPKLRANVGRYLNGFEEYAPKAATATSANAPKFPIRQDARVFDSPANVAESVAFIAGDTFTDADGKKWLASWRTVVDFTPVKSLPSTTESAKNERAIKRAARAVFPMRKAAAYRVVFEHGHYWLIITEPAGDERTFDVVDTDNGFDFEEVG